MGVHKKETRKVMNWESCLLIFLAAYPELHLILFVLCCGMFIALCFYKQYIQDTPSNKIPPISHEYISTPIKEKT